MDYQLLIFFNFYFELIHKIDLIVYSLFIFFENKVYHCLCSFTLWQWIDLYCDATMIYLHQYTMYLFYWHNLKKKKILT